MISGGTLSFQWDELVQFLSTWLGPMVNELGKISTGVCSRQETNIYSNQNLDCNACNDRTSKYHRICVWKYEYLPDGYGIWDLNTSQNRCRRENVTENARMMQNLQNVLQKDCLNICQNARMATLRRTCQKLCHWDMPSLDFCPVHHFHEKKMERGSP